MCAVENLAHNDFSALRNILIRTHMMDLVDVTAQVFYENYRITPPLLDASREMCVFPVTCAFPLFVQIRHVLIFVRRIQQWTRLMRG
jgi:hypothetical protein